MAVRPRIDDFPADCMNRSMRRLPRQGGRTPWLVNGLPDSPAFVLRVNEASGARRHDADAKALRSGIANIQDDLPWLERIDPVLGEV